MHELTLIDQVHNPPLFSCGQVVECGLCCTFYHLIVCCQALENVTPTKNARFSVLRIFTAVILTHPLVFDCSSAMNR